MRKFLSVLVPLLLLGSSFTAGCGGDDDRFSYAGYNMYDHFPLDGSLRQWYYQNEDESIDWQLLVEKLETQRRNGADVVTLEHSNYDSGDVLLEVYWSSDSVNGVMIHGYQNVSAGEDPFWFETPVLFADVQMKPGDSVTTETDGFVFTSTFEQITGCPTYWTSEWENESCLQVHIEDDDGLDATNAAFTGTYWLVPRYGVAWMDLAYYEMKRWNLADHKWQE